METLIKLGVGVCSPTLFEKSEIDFLNCFPISVKRLYFPNLSDNDVIVEFKKAYSKYGKYKSKSVSKRSRNT